MGEGFFSLLFNKNILQCHSFVEYSIVSRAGHTSASLCPAQSLSLLCLSLSLSLYVSLSLLSLSLSLSLYVWAGVGATAVAVIKCALFH